MRSRREGSDSTAEQRSVEGDLRDFEGRRVGVESVEPGVARLRRKRLVGEGRRHGGFGVGSERGEPATPRRADVPDRRQLHRSHVAAVLVVPIAGHQDSEPYHPTARDRKTSVVMNCPQSRP